MQTLIRSFRNDANPQIAVTVDLLTTGIDVPKITNLVFLRRVNSRILYEQMIGRATRQCPEIGKEVFRIFDAVDLYPHLQNLTDMKPVVVNPSISFEQLVRELVEATDEGLEFGIVAQHDAAPRGVALDEPESGIVPGILVLAAGVAQPDDEFHR